MRKFGFAAAGVVALGLFGCGGGQSGAEVTPKPSPGPVTPGPVTPQPPAPVDPSPVPNCGERFAVLTFESSNGFEQEAVATLQGVHDAVEAGEPFLRKINGIVYGAWGRKVWQLEGQEAVLLFEADTQILHFDVFAEGSEPTFYTIQETYGQASTNTEVEAPAPTGAPLRVTAWRDTEDGYGPIHERDYPETYNSYRVALGDVNEDGMVDIVLHGNRFLYGITRTNDGGFGAMQTLYEPMPDGGSLVLEKLHLADLDNDGDIDVAVHGIQRSSGTGAPTVSLVTFMRAEAGFSRIAHDLGPTQGSARVAQQLADLDGNGRLDPVWAEGGSVNVAWGSAAGFTSEVLFTGGQGLVTEDEWPAVGDITGDLLPDIVFSNLVLQQEQGGTFVPVPVGQNLGTAQTLFLVPDSSGTSESAVSPSEVFDAGADAEAPALTSITYAAYTLASLPNVCEDRCEEEVPEVLGHCVECTEDAHCEGGCHLSYCVECESDGQCDATSACGETFTCERVVSHEGGWEKVVHGGYSGCGLRDGGQLSCWGGIAVEMAGVELVDVAVQREPDWVCGIEINGVLHCSTEDSSDPTDGALPQGPFAQIVSVADAMCALRESGEVVCFDRQADSTNESTHEGPYVQLAATTSQVCALTLDGTVECWKPAFSEVEPVDGQGPQQPTTTPGSEDAAPPNDVPLSSFAVVEGGGCGIHTEEGQSAGTLHCWGTLPAPPSGDFTNVMVGFGSACAVSSASDVICWGQQAWVPRSTEDFESVFSAGGTPCGLRVDGHFECARAFDRPGAP